jgi:HSP20 family protein
VASKRQDEDWFFRIGEELQRLSDEVMRGIVVNSAAANRFWRPNVDVCEAQDEITLTVELAGVLRRDMTIQYVAKSRSLILRGRRRAVDLPDCQPSRSHQLEVYYGEFEREIRLPEVAVDPEGIQASFSDGMLVVRIPKRTVGHSRRSIPVTEDNG